MGKNVNLDKQVDGHPKSWGVTQLINHISFDVQLVTSLERGVVGTDMNHAPRHTACFFSQNLGMQVYFNC